MKIKILILLFLASTSSLGNQDKYSSFIREYLSSFSKRDTFTIHTEDSDKAVEYQIRYHPEDHGEFFLLSGHRLRLLRSLLNEMSIGEQRREAEAARDKFDYHKRKLVLVRFIKDDNIK